MKQALLGGIVGGLIVLMLGVGSASALSLRAGYGYIPDILQKKELVKELVVVDQSPAVRSRVISDDPLTEREIRRIVDSCVRSAINSAMNGYNFIGC